MTFVCVVDIARPIYVGDTSPPHRRGHFNWIFVNHGEPEASRSFVEAIRSEFDADVVVPQPGEKFDLK